MCIAPEARDFASLASDPITDGVRVDSPQPAFPRLELPAEAAA
jgi:methionyl-tRNA synthetase